MTAKPTPPGRPVPSRRDTGPTALPGRHRLADDAGVSENLHHRIVIVGGGTAGITVAARLRRAGEDDIAVIEPSAVHRYQPLWTLVGSGHASVQSTLRPEADVMPRGVHWIQSRVAHVDPDEQQLVTDSDLTIGYDVCVMAPGIELDWDAIPGLRETLGKNGVVSNYTAETAERTWAEVRSLEGGRALFTQPDGPIKCGGAPQKAAYMTADHLRRHGRLDSTEIVFSLPGDGLFGLPEFKAVLEGVMERYGIDVRYRTELVEVRPDAREALLRTTDGTQTVPYDLLHVVPPQRAPAFVRDSPLAMPGDARGWIDADAHTLVHNRYPSVFALGDAAGIPAAKTGAAVRKQAPVVTANVLATLAGRELEASYDGYSSCPIVTAQGKMLLAEFDYSMTHHKTIPLLDTVRERRDMWYLKRYGLPFLYWNLMLKGLA